MRDWKAIAAALKVDLPEPAVERLQALEKTLLGLRGLIDWQEEPAVLFDGEIPEWPERPGPGAAQ
jgi:hypothetical protein